LHGIVTAGSPRADPSCGVREQADRGDRRLALGRQPAASPILRSVTRSRTLSAPVSATRALAEIAEDLVRRVLADHRDERTIALLAISVSHLEAHPIVQLELPLGTRSWHKKGRGAIARRPGRRCDPQAFGAQAVDYGSASRVGRSVPDEFRRLAEREL
jgi:DNA polymerase IV